MGQTGGGVGSPSLALCVCLLLRKKDRPLWVGKEAACMHDLFCFSREVCKLSNFSCILSGEPRICTVLLTLSHDEFIMLLRWGFCRTSWHLSASQSSNMYSAALVSQSRARSRCALLLQFLTLIFLNVCDVQSLCPWLQIQVAVTSIFFLLLKATSLLFFMLLKRRRRVPCANSQNSICVTVWPFHRPNLAAGDIEDHCRSCCDCVCWTYKVSQSWHSLVLEGLPRWNQLVMTCLFSWQ